MKALRTFIGSTAIVATTGSATWMRRIACGLALAALGACSGDGSGGPRYALGGTVTGLLGTVVLRTNTGDQLSISQDGEFAFPSRIMRRTNYHVTVMSQPALQTCTVLNGTGQIRDADVTDLRVVCGGNRADSVPIVGTINGLAGSITMSWYLYADEQTFTANGPFSFAEQSASGNSYAVTVVRQPDGQTCSVANGFGTVGISVINVIVSCVDSTAVFAVGGDVSGLTGAGLRIEADPTNGVDLAPGATGFTLPVRLGNTVAYDVGVAAQPAGQTCVVTNANGAINAADVTDIEVDCFDKTTDPLAGTYVAPGFAAGTYVTLFPDGVYLVVSIENDPYFCDVDTRGNGVEYGVYHYDAATHSLSLQAPAVDTNGICGIWNNYGHSSYFNGALTVTGSGAATVLTLAPSTRGGSFDLVPAPSIQDEIVGSWVAPYQKNVVMFLPAGGGRLHYLMTETQADLPPMQTGAVAGVELGCATVDTPTAGRLDVDYSPACDVPAGLVDTNGRSGLRPDYASVSFAVSGDTMMLNGVEYRRLRVP